MVKRKNEQLKQAIEQLIGDASGERASVRRQRSVAGGDINAASVVELVDSRQFFVKSNARPLPGMFEREAEGLAALAQVGVLRVPRPLGVGPTGVTPFIVMEWIETRSARGDFSARFGRSFAEHHRKSEHTKFGFAEDNYIGSTPQPNCWADDWVSFFAEQRLGYQLRLARDSGVSDPRLDRLGNQLLARLHSFIGEPAEPACLLHGDLWGGNYLCDTKGEPVLIDPAVYFGRREADLAMTMLFGGFGADFYAAYEASWPLAAGSEERIAIYKLYHLLNHLNLFGGSYREGCVSILQRLV